MFLYSISLMKQKKFILFLIIVYVVYHNWCKKKNSISAELMCESDDCEKNSITN